MNQPDERAFALDVPRAFPAQFPRGAVLDEVLKHRTHRGERGGLSFYRDRNGTEIDLVVEHPTRLLLIEAKSGATASPAWLTAARRVSAHLEGLGPRCDAAVVYGGAALQQRTHGQLAPRRDVASVASPGETT